MISINMTDDKTTDVVDVRVTFNDEGRGYCESVTIFGRIIAGALGRYSGALLGDGVRMEAGKVGSGGSRKNWETVIEAGSVFILYDVSRHLVDMHDDEGVSIEVITQKNA